MIIGIAGKAGCGKDTVADYLCSRFGFQKDSLAAPLKRLVQDVFVVDETTMNDRDLRERNMANWDGWTVRKLLQFIGTDLIRTQIDGDVWVKSLCLRHGPNPRGHIVVPDLRFPNELDYMKKVYGPQFLSVKVVRPGVAAPSGGITGHASESYDLQTSVTLTNDGTISDLFRKVDSFLVRNVVTIDETPLNVR